MKLKLENTSTGKIEEIVSDPSKVRIGRADSNDIMLKGMAISRFHAEIVRPDREIMLKDLGSKNGTYLNGNRISTASPLKNGDLIRIGDYVLHCLDVHYSEEEKGAFSVIGILDKVRLLRKINLFEGLLFDDLAAISRISRTTSFESSAVIFRQNDPGDAVYVIIEGRVDITEQSGTGEETVKQMGPPEYFGVTAILDDKPRSSTAAAADASLLLRIRKEDFNELLQSRPALTSKMLRLFSSRTSREGHDRN